MTNEGYKLIILHQLKKAADCEDVEKIIKYFIESMQGRHLYPGLIAYYLHRLRDDLEDLSPHNFDAVHWCNIKCAIVNLRKITGKQH